MSIEKTAHFTLFANIAARTPEEGEKTARALTKIVSVIMEAYRIVVDSGTNHQQKLEAIGIVCNLLPELEWLEKFTKSQADLCKIPEEQLKLKRAHQTVAQTVNDLKQRFRTVRNNVDEYKTVFRDLLGLLDTTKSFMEQGHDAEVAKSMEKGDVAVSEIGNILNCEYAKLLVPTAKAAAQRINEFFDGARAMVEAAGASGSSFSAKVDNFQNQANDALSELLVASRTVFQSGDTPGSKLAQKQSHDKLKRVLIETRRLLETLKSNYSSSFDESESARRPVVQIAQPDVEDLRRNPGDLLEAAKRMCKALGDMNLTLDGPDDPALPYVPKSLLVSEDTEDMSSKKSLIEAAEEVQRALGGLNVALQ
jgi:soluble cytochrome b562